MKTVKNNNFYL